MTSILSFFVSLFSTLVWLIALVVFAAIMLYFVNKPLLAKCISYIATYVSSEKEIVSGGTKENARPKRGKMPSNSDNERLNDKLRQALKRINELEQQCQLMNVELETKDDTISKLQGQLITAQNELWTLKQKMSNAERIIGKKEEDTYNTRQQNNRLYAYAPTAVSPYGFSNEDLQPNDKGQVFVMIQESKTKASFILNKNCPTVNVLGSLAYYDRLIDYEDHSDGNNASKIEMLKEGCLLLNEGVWTIESKIKIKLL